MVESTIRYSKSGSPDIASKMRHQTPLRLHRLKRRKTRFQPPGGSGRARQGEPVRTIHSTPSTNIRLSRPVEPFWSRQSDMRALQAYKTAADAMSEAIDKLADDQTTLVQ